jgi:deazaflavin-dependent oxidoreductase (nitroreductase family)
MSALRNRRRSVARVMARVNKRVTNRVIGLWAPYLVPYAQIEHTGRRSGRTYRTPVLAARVGSVFYVPVLYGEHSDWVRNVLAAGGCHVRHGGRAAQLCEPRVIDAAGAPDAVARILGRPSGRILVARWEAI